MVGMHFPLLFLSELSIHIVITQRLSELTCSQKSPHNLVTELQYVGAIVVLPFFLLVAFGEVWGKIYFI